MSESAFAGVPPPAPSSRKDIVRVTTCEVHHFVCLSRRCRGVGVHWSGKRTQPCTKDDGHCEGCALQMPWKWKGYLHVTICAGRWDGFLELTPTAAQLLDAQRHQSKDLRGLQFKISRTKGGARGRYVVEVLERRMEEATLPEERDVMPVLKFLWSAKRSGHFSA